MSGPPVVNGRWDSAYHAPVLAAEILDLIGDARVALDCTLGGGGHTLAMLEAGVQRVTAIDRDPEAIASARARLASFEAAGRLTIVRGNYADAASLDGVADVHFDAILADLGISSHQVDDASRGFSFREGAPLDMRMGPVGSTYPHKGELFAMDREVDLRTGSIRMAAQFPNPDRVLRPGQFARVRVLAETKKGALLVPQRAVMEIQGFYQVAVVGPDNVAAIRSVKVGERVGRLWLIEDGLKQDDTVVVEGTQKVRDGAKVNPQPWTPPAEETATEDKQP